MTFYVIFTNLILYGLLPTNIENNRSYKVVGITDHTVISLFDNVVYVTRKMNAVRLCVTSYAVLLEFLNDTFLIYNFM